VKSSSCVNQLTEIAKGFEVIRHASRAAGYAVKRASRVPTAQSMQSWDFVRNLFLDQSLPSQLRFSSTRSVPSLPNATL